jgi:sigma-B regulation protein RsbU (phosphoserine phosphatase)
VPAEVAQQAPLDAVARRVRLPADRRTPAAARAVVRSVLVEARLTELLDEALLLTTELSTNGVLHAGTDLDLEIVADDTGLTVTVLDMAPGPLDTRLPDTGEPPAERGRGLLLVDHFATRWGTTHHATGKGVWFRLDRPGTDLDAGPAVPAPDPKAHPDADGFGAESLTALLKISYDPHGEASAARFAEDLLTSLGERLGATAGVIRLDRADGSGSQVLARYGMRLVPGDPGVLRLPVPVSRPWVAELEIAAPPTSYARPLAALVAERVGFAVDNERLRQADVRRQSWLTFMAEASELLAQSLEVELTLALIPRLVVPRLGQWSAVHVVDEWGTLSLAAATHADEALMPSLMAMLESPPVMERFREALAGSGSTPLGQPAEGFMVPLVARGQRLGVLAVGRHADHRQDPGEMAILADVARRAGLALDNARIHAERRRVAHALQQSLLPPALPVIPDVELAAEYVPSSDEVEVGGDFYDVLPMPDGRWLLVIGDVSGKGVQAAAVTGHVRDVVRVLIEDGRPLFSVLSTLNETLAARGGGRYCTLALAALGRTMDGGLDVSLHLAGHDRPVLLTTNGRTSFVGDCGTALGLLEAVSSPPTSVALRPGDTLVFYTDGVTERRRQGELFGTERLRTAAAPLAGYPAEVVAARLRSVTLGFSAEPPRDDIAILVVRNAPVLDQR